MEKFSNLPNLAKAVIAVMKDVKNIEKTSNVGVGASAYKGVEDKEVKHAIGEAMERHGLCMLPIGISPNLRIDRWEETTNYNNTPQTKAKQQVFTEVVTKYLLLHESGESVELEGYGHGVDTQDKAAGKATTYAMKYAMLYTFMVPTGKIDDADTTHSNEHAQPPANKPAQQAKPQQPKANTTPQPANAPAPQAVNTPLKVPALTQEQLDKALASDEKGITATLSIIDKGKVAATPAQKKQLEDKLAELKPKK